MPNQKLGVGVLVGPTTFVIRRVGVAHFKLGDAETNGATRFGEIGSIGRQRFRKVDPQILGG